MQLYRNLFICASILTVSAILTHGLATGLPYWIYRMIPGVKHRNKTADVLAYEGLFKACIEYDDVVVKHIKQCINTPNRNWLLNAPHKDWIIPERYLVGFAMGCLVFAFVMDILVTLGLLRTKHMASASCLLSVWLILIVLVIYGSKSDSTSYYVAFYCEIISLILAFISSCLRLTICRGEKHGPYDRIDDRRRINS